MKNLKTIAKFFKGITVILIGFIIPVHSLAAQNETKYKCTFKGVKTYRTDYIESWASIRKSFIEWCIAK